MSFLTRRRSFHPSATLVCIVSLSGSQSSPFFQSRSAIAEILARQRDFGQFLAYAAADARVIEVFQWAGLGRGRIRRPLEHVLERGVVIAIEPTGERCARRRRSFPSTNS